MSYNSLVLWPSRSRPAHILASTLPQTHEMGVSSSVQIGHVGGCRAPSSSVTKGAAPSRLRRKGVDVMQSCWPRRGEVVRPTAKDTNVWPASCARRMFRMRSRSADHVPGSRAGNKETRHPFPARQQIGGGTQPPFATVPACYCR